MQRVTSSTQKTQSPKSHLAWRLITTLAAALTASACTFNQPRPQTAINTEDKKMIVMLIKRVNGQIGSEFIVDADGFAVEFKSESQIQNQIKMLKASDPTIIDFVIE
jgi:hypothetical protein